MKLIKKLIIPVALVGVGFVAVKKFGLWEKVKGLFKKGETK